MVQFIFSMHFSKKLFIATGSLMVLLVVLVVTVLILKSERILPSVKKNIVPFTSQAPEGDWQEPWQNACEEASIVMIQNFYKDERLTIDKARQQILAVFKLKKDTAPASKDESLERIAEIINSGD